MSRPIERIEPFLEKVRIRYVIKYIFKLPRPIDATYVKYVFDKNKKEVREYWLENPDLRFSQVLVNLNIIPNIPGYWHHLEDEEILIRLDYSPEKVYFWEVNLDVDENSLHKTVWKPISELTSDHLKAIINGGFVKNNKMYRQLMLKTLRKRGERL